MGKREWEEEETGEQEKRMVEKEITVFLRIVLLYVCKFIKPIKSVK